MTFNVTLIEPDGYVHAQALADAADYLVAMLEACGQPARRSRNHIELDGHNVVLCSHLLGPAHLAQLPARTILFNSEQLGDDGGWHLASGTYARALARFRVWDYAHGNLVRIPHDRVSVIPFLYCAALVRPTIRERGEALLFYGSLTDRRRRILDALRERGLPVEAVFGEYGNELDRRMFRARAVLNLHKSDDATVFEPVRCFYPLINRIPVISEHVDGEPAADAFRDAVAFCAPDALVDDIVRWWSAADELANRTEQFQTTSAHDSIARAVAECLAD